MRREEWGEWLRETLLFDVPHRQVVFTIPKMLRIFFRYNRKLFGELCHCALRSLILYFEAVRGSELIPGVIGAIQTFGDRFNVHSRVLAKTKKEAERVGKYMIRPPLSVHSGQSGH